MTAAAHPSQPPSGRLARLVEALERERCAAALLVGSSHAVHLAGYSRLYSGPTALIVSPAGETAMLVPRYEVDAARSLARVGSVTGYGDDGFGLDLGAATRLGEACAELLPPGPIGIASDVPGVAEVAFAGTGREAVDLTAVIGELRLVKDADECELIARAYELALSAQAAVGHDARPGVREIDLYTAAFARAQTEAGAPIEFSGDLLAGARTARVCGPVAVPGTEMAKEGDVVVADLSVRHAGYWGDTARTFVVGRNDEAERAIEFLGEVLADCAAAMRPGVLAADIYARMRSAITLRYPDGSFPHHAGHGVGVTVFEDPHLIPADRMALRDGMVIAVEPGVYLRGRFGARVENVYRVTSEGGRDLLEPAS